MRAGVNFNVDASKREIFLSFDGVGTVMWVGYEVAVCEKVYSEDEVLLNFIDLSLGWIV